MSEGRKGGRNEERRGRVVPALSMSERDKGKGKWCGGMTASRVGAHFLFSGERAKGAGVE